MTIVLIISILVTSFISGVFGMAGGMILMGIFGFLLPVPTAMILHGFTQAIANGYRALLLRNSIQWSVMAPYLVGVAISLGCLSALQIVLPKSLLFILLGLFPFMTLWLPQKIQFNILNPWHAGICGLTISGVQILAGASGPLLDVFYLKSPLDRLQIVATKAFTQFLGHVFKIIYYAALLHYSFQNELSLWIFPLAVVSAVTGTAMGKEVLQKLSEKKFQLYSWRIIAFIGLVCLARGIYLLEMG